MRRAMKWIRIIVFLFVLIGGGCQQVDKRVACGIKEGQKLYLEGNYLSAERKLTNVIELGPREEVVGEAYYLRGLVRLRLDRVILAEQDFLKVLELSKREDLRTNTYICLGAIYYDRGDWINAYRHYKEAVGHLGKLSPSDWILYKLGVSAQRIGRWEESKKYFARLIREFPRSEAAKLAEKKIKYNAFIVQAGAFRNYRYALVRLKQIKGLGFSGEVEKSDGLYLVLVGKYPTYYQAESVFKKIKSVVDDVRIVP